MKKRKALRALAGMLLLLTGCTGSLLPVPNGEVMTLTQEEDTAQTAAESAGTETALQVRTKQNSTKQNTTAPISGTKEAQSDSEPEFSSAVAHEPESGATVQDTDRETETVPAVFSPAEIPAYSGEPYCEINGNVPFFTESEITAEAFEEYSEPDGLNRCGVCMACIGQELMPTEPRGSIGAVKPTGWHLIRYDDYVEGKYLYNRCHLIAFMLTGENANERNLITGTRWMNTVGMLPFETKTADYIRASGNHVLYRVTPVFTGENLLADGVLMEAYSVEDGGRGLQFNVFCYNVQPFIEIDYATGESRLQEDAPPPQTAAPVQTDPPVERTVPAPVPDENADYILNTNTMRFHAPDCPSVADIKEKNRQSYTGDREALIEEGYVPCGRCKP